MNRVSPFILAASMMAFGAHAEPVASPYMVATTVQASNGVKTVVMAFSCSTSEKMAEQSKPVIPSGSTVLTVKAYHLAGKKCSDVIPTTGTPL
jgi:hypothetical protein